MPYKDPEKNREYQRNWAKANIAKNPGQRNKKRRDWLHSLKTPCIFCGEDEPVCIDFHHLDPSIKEDRLAKMVGEVSKERVLQEVAKCVCVCSNCHRKLHAGIITLPLWSNG